MTNIDDSIEPTSATPSLFHAEHDHVPDFITSGISQSILATGMLVQEFLRDSFNLLKESPISMEEPQSNSIIEDTESEDENDDILNNKNFDSYSHSEPSHWSTSPSTSSIILLDDDDPYPPNVNSNFGGGGDSHTSHHIRTQLIEEPILSGL